MQYTTCIHMDLTSAHARFTWYCHFFFLKNTNKQNQTQKCILGTKGSRLTRILVEKITISYWWNFYSYIYVMISMFLQRPKTRLNTRIYSSLIILDQATKTNESFFQLVLRKSRIYVIYGIIYARQ